MNAPKNQPNPKVDPIKPPDDRKPSLDVQAIILITGCCLIWGYQQIAIQAIADEVPLLMQLTIRSIIASACVWAWMAFKGIRPFQPDRTFIPGLIAGLLYLPVELLNRAATDIPRLFFPLEEKFSMWKKPWNIESMKMRRSKICLPLLG
jgi:hypothetical protein